MMRPLPLILSGVLAIAAAAGCRPGSGTDTVARASSNPEGFELIEIIDLAEVGARQLLGAKVGGDFPLETPQDLVAIVRIEGATAPPKADLLVGKAVVGAFTELIDDQRGVAAIRIPGYVPGDEALTLRVQNGAKQGEWRIPGNGPGIRGIPEAVQSRESVQVGSATVKATAKRVAAPNGSAVVMDVVATGESKPNRLLEFRTAHVKPEFIAPDANWKPDTTYGNLAGKQPRVRIVQADAKAALSSRMLIEGVLAECRVVRFTFRIPASNRRALREGGMTLANPQTVALAPGLSMTLRPVSTGITDGRPGLIFDYVVRGQMAAWDKALGDSVRKGRIDLSAETANWQDSFAPMRGNLGANGVLVVQGRGAGVLPRPNVKAALPETFHLRWRTTLSEEPFQIAVPIKGDVPATIEAPGVAFAGPSFTVGRRTR